MNDEIRMIRDGVARYLADLGGLAPARACHDGATDPALWTGLAQDLQLCGLTLPEAVGGMGLGLAAQVPVAQELGRVLAPAPFVSTVGLVAEVLRHACSGTEAPLRAIAEGAVHGALAAWDFDSFSAEPAPGGFALTGTSGLVPDLEGATLVLVPARLAGEPALFALGAGVEVQRAESFDPTRPVARLELDAHPVPAAGRLTLRDGARGLHQALERAQVVLAAEASGAARGLFDLTQDYIAGRVQFGRTISSFQAIKHRMAALFVALNSLDALVAGAAEAADADDPLAGAEARAAWSMAREMQLRVAAASIQLHGGVGVTWEYAPHLFFKRARAQAHLPAAPGQGFAGLGRALLAGDLAAVPPAPDTAFRTRVRDWLTAHLAGRFAPLVDRGHAGDGDTLVDLRKDWERDMAAGGWLGLGLPESAGGRGLSVADQVAFHEEYARVGGPGRMGHIGEGLVAPTLLAFGTEDQKARFLPGILRGETYWAQGYSEPGAGSDLAAVRTRARQCPQTGDWLVTGQKIWTSLAHVSDWIFVLARAEEGSVGRNGLIFLLMPLAQPGIEFRPIRQMGGSAEFNEVFFDEARAKPADAIGAPGEGWRVAMALLGFERGISTLGQQMGFARELASVIALAQGQGAPAEALGRAWAGLRAMRHGALRMLQAQAEGQAGAAMLGYKYEWSEWHKALGDLAMEVLGGQAAAWSGQAEARRLQHLYLFSRADTIYGGTSEIQLNIIAELGLKMPREPRGAGK